MLGGKRGGERGYLPNSLYYRNWSSTPLHLKPSIVLLWNSWLHCDSCFVQAVVRSNDRKFSHMLCA